MREFFWPLDLADRRNWDFKFFMTKFFVFLFFDFYPFCSFFWTIDLGGSSLSYQILDRGWRKSGFELFMIETLYFTLSDPHPFLSNPLILGANALYHPSRGSWKEEIGIPFFITKYLLFLHFHSWFSLCGNDFWLFDLFCRLLLSVGFQDVNHGMWVHHIFIVWTVFSRLPAFHSRFSLWGHSWAFNLVQI